jgi:phosphoesterase RecJ-like protein
MAADLEQLLQRHKSVTVVSHIHPDADAIGTSLGIYTWLKEQGKKVEVVNATKDIPRYLDFIPSFKNIKHKIDFDDSLVVSCDSGALDRLGFDIKGRDIVNIDHHPTNTYFGTVNLVDPNAVASSVIAYRVLSLLGKISPPSATAFYVALVSDTRNFTVGNVTKDTFDLSGELVELGVDVPYVTSQMHHRRSLASLRILATAIDSLNLCHNGRIAVMNITREERQKSGAKESDLDGIVDYARSLATVQIAVLTVERGDEIKVSIRSKGADVSKIAQEFGGGGHREAAGFELRGVTVDACIDMLLRAIEKKEILQ